jgi:hypothetical protein
MLQTGKLARREEGSLEPLRLVSKFHNWLIPMSLKMSFSHFTRRPGQARERDGVTPTGVEILVIRWETFNGTSDVFFPSDMFLY